MLSFGFIFVTISFRFGTKNQPKSCSKSMKKYNRKSYSFLLRFFVNFLSILDPKLEPFGRHLAPKCSGGVWGNPLRLRAQQTFASKMPGWHIWAPFWLHFGTDSLNFCCQDVWMNHFGFILSSFWDRCGTIFRTIWHRFGTIWGPFLDP